MHQQSHKAQFAATKQRFTSSDDSLLTVLFSVLRVLLCTQNKCFNPIALRKAKIVYNFGLSECNRGWVKQCKTRSQPKRSTVCWWHLGPVSQNYFVISSSKYNEKTQHCELRATNSCRKWFCETGLRFLTVYQRVHIYYHKFLCYRIRCCEILVSALEPLLLRTQKCKSIGKHKTINFSFVTNGILMFLGILISKACRVEIDSFQLQTFG